MIASIALVAAIGTAAVLMVGGLAYFRAAPTATRSGAYFRAADIVVDHDCGGVFDYCVRGTCLITNTGNADGTATVLFDMNPGTTNPAQATESVFIPRGESRSLVHEFTEASALADTTQIGCRVIGSR